MTEQNKVILFQANIHLISTFIMVVRAHFKLGEIGGHSTLRSSLRYPHFPTTKLQVSSPIFVFSNNSCYTSTIFNIKNAAQYKRRHFTKIIKIG